MVIQYEALELNRYCDSFYCEKLWFSGKWLLIEIKFEFLKYMLKNVLAFMVNCKKNLSYVFQISAC